MIHWRVYAMARPGRPTAELAAVLDAAALFRRPTISATAAAIAKRVAEDCVAYADSDRSDELIAVLAQLAAVAQPAPIRILSRSPDIDTVGMVFSARTRRFQARGCRQLSETEWKVETAAITAEVTGRLASRYRKMLRDCWQKPVFRQPDAVRTSPLPTGDPE